MAIFKGVIVPMVTPFNRDELASINVGAAEQLIDRLISAGVSGIFIFGSNGEFHLCSRDEKIRFAHHVIDFVKGRIPVYVGTGSCSTEEACELSHEMEQLGADAVSVINPYFMQLTDEEIIRYYESVAKSVNIPIILYNIPKCTGMNLSPNVVSKLASIDNIKGIKDSSGDTRNLAGYIEAAAGNDMDVLVGSDGAISTGFAMGASGAIAGTANLIPQVVVNLIRALQEGDAARAQRFQDDLEPLRNVLHKASVPAVLKRSLELSGLPLGAPRRPVMEAAEELDREIVEMLDHYGIDHG